MKAIGAKKIKLSPLAKNMIFTICVAALILMAAGAIFYRSIEALYFAFGAFLSCSLNVFKVIMLERSVEKALEMEGNKAGNYIRIQYLLRFILTGLVFTLAALCPFINLWGAAGGIFTLPIAAFMTRFQNSEEKADGSDK